MKLKVLFWNWKINYSNQKKKKKILNKQNLKQKYLKQKKIFEIDKRLIYLCHVFNYV